MRQRIRTPDHVDAIQREWRRALPAVDASAIGVTGRITRIALYTDRQAHDHFGRFRLSASGFEVLTSLHRARPRGLSPTSLGRDQKMSSAGITGLLDQLEGAALVTRAPDPRDRRRVLLTVTSKGADLVGVAAAGAAVGEERLSRALGTPAKTSLHVLLSRLLGMVEPGLDLRRAGTSWCISRVAAHINHAADDLFQRFGLSHGGFQVLASLYRSGPPYRRSPSGVARGLMLSSAGMTGRMDQLERNGLLLRQRDLDDRRGVIVQLTDQGAQLVRISFRAFVRSHERMLDRALKADEQSALATLLHQALLGFESSNGAAP